nr:MAG TPA: hypothetical protein [Caudoviricetes sp.]
MYLRCTSAVIPLYNPVPFTVATLFLRAVISP